MSIYYPIPCVECLLKSRDVTAPESVAEVSLTANLPHMHPILKKLQGGDRRSIGESNAVVVEVLASPELVNVLIDGLLIDDAVVRMRASDALEKVSVAQPDLVEPYKAKLIGISESAAQIEVQWHMALMLPRLALTHEESVAVVDVLISYLSGRSSIVSTCVMQAFYEIAQSDKELAPDLVRHIREMTKIGTKAMQARGKKLLASVRDDVSAR